MRQLLVSSSPHIKISENVPTVMWCVVVALLPAWLAAVYFYGISALLLGTVCMLLCMLIEYAIVYVRTKPQPKAAVPRKDPHTQAPQGVIKAAEIKEAEKTPVSSRPSGFFHSVQHEKAWATATDGSAAVTGLLFAMVIKPNTLFWVAADGSTVSEWYVVLVGCVFAIGFAKHLFGGLGCNIWNPALAARAFVQVSYAQEVNGSFLEPFAWSTAKSGVFFGRVAELSSGAPGPLAAKKLGIDAISQSTPLEWYKQGKVAWSMTKPRLESVADALHLSDWTRLPEQLASYMKYGGDLQKSGIADRMTEAGLSPDQIKSAGSAIYDSVWGNMLDMLPNHWLGGTAGSMGETSALLLLLGGLFLWARGYLDWRIPLGFLGTVAVLSLILPYKSMTYGFSFLRPEHIWYKPAFQLGAGGLMLGAWFMATDMVSSPVSKKGNLVFGVGCGVLTVIIRNFAAYPEGVCYAILIMNTTTPMIDRFTKPRVFGTSKKSAKEAEKT